jgi:hypothetical protein
MILVTVVRHDSPWVPLQRISALLLGPDALTPPGELSLTIAGFALLIHLPLSFCYGRLIALVVRRVRPALAWIAGAACGLAMYVLDYQIIGPLIFRWFDDSQGAVTAFDHLLFGAVAALAFVTLRSRTATATNAMPDR